jgi:acetoacetyl-CoA synthetase
MKEAIWKPSRERIQQANITRFITLVNERFGLKIETYADLQKWSVAHIPEFWSLMWEFGEVRASVPYESAVTDLQDMLDVRWFPGARLNFAENLLRYRDERTALVFKGEGRAPRRITSAELVNKGSQ